MNPTWKVMRYFLTLALFIGLQPAAAQDHNLTGFLDESTPAQNHVLAFNAGDTVLLLAETINGDLDPYLSLYGKDEDKALAENDDYNPYTYDSAIVYTIPDSGSYTVRVEPFEVGESSGGYNLTVRVGGEELFDYLESIQRLRLSGTPQTLDTTHFRIHYTLEGADDTSETYVQMIAEALEETWRIQIEAMGWPPPPPDEGHDGDDHYDVYIASLKKDADVTMGYAEVDQVIGDNPNSEAVEEYGGSSFLVIENDFSESLDNPEEQRNLLRATVAHEFH
ncbi:MAG: hypothetical protein K8I30_08055, partial [Anaerolineae bacterium]|nr:hypothetical protein [Anaerolineae bacterium]